MKHEIELDMYVDLEPEGIRRSLYVGVDACEPELESIDSWEEIINRNIEYYILPKSNTISSDDIAQLKKIIAGMEKGLALFKERLKEYDWEPNEE